MWAQTHAVATTECERAPADFRYAPVKMCQLCLLGVACKVARNRLPPMHPSSSLVSSAMQALVGTTATTQTAWSALKSKLCTQRHEYQVAHVVPIPLVHCRVTGQRDTGTQGSVARKRINDDFLMRFRVSKCSSTISCGLLAIAEFLACTRQMSQCCPPACSSHRACSKQLILTWKRAFGSRIETLKSAHAEHNTTLSV